MPNYSCLEDAWPNLKTNKQSHDLNKSSMNQNLYYQNDKQNTLHGNHNNNNNNQTSDIRRRVDLKPNPDNRRQGTSINLN